MMRSSVNKPVLLGLVCAALLGAPARRASAQDPPPPAAAAPAAEPSPEAKREAGERFQRGVKFHKDAEYQAAHIEFKRAYELAPNYRVLYNLGQTSRELKDHAGALRYFERYLAEGGKEIDAKRRRDVEQWVAELRPKVAHVTLSTAPEGAEITVDDVLVGVTPLAEPLVLNAGRRKINAALSGHAPVQRFIDVAGSEKVDVALELSPLAPPAPPEEPRPKPEAGTVVLPGPLTAPPPAPPDEGMSALPWIGLAATGALGVGWGVLGVTALGAQSDFEEELDHRTTPQAVDDARSKAQTFALVADIVGGVTIAAAALTAVAFAVELGGKDEKPTRPAPVSVSVRIGPGSLGVGGRF